MREWLLVLSTVFLSLYSASPLFADDSTTAKDLYQLSDEELAKLVVPSDVPVGMGMGSGPLPCTDGKSGDLFNKIAEAVKPAAVLIESDVADKAQQEKDKLQQCVTKLKKAALERMPIFDSPATDTDDDAATLNTLLKTGKIEDETFTRGQENAPAPNNADTSFKIRRKENGNDKAVSFTYSLKAGVHQETQKPQFQFVIKTALKTNGVIQKQFQQEFRADASCNLQPYANQLTTFTYLGENVRVRQTTFLFPDEKEDKERVVPRKLVDNAAILDELDPKHGLPDKLSLDAFGGVDASNFHVEFEKQGPTELQPDLILGKVVPFQPYVIRLYQDGKLFVEGRIVQSTQSDSGTMEMSMPAAPDYRSTEEGVSKTIWEQTPLINSKEPTNVTLEGFSKDDFSQPQITYDIKAGKPLQFENLAAYGAVETLPSDDAKHHLYRFTDGQVSRPQLASTSSPKYLKETEFFDISSPEVQQLIAKVKQKNPSTKEATAREILRLVNETIQYDYAMLDKQSTRLLPASVVAKRKSGVCQHFAALYVAIARGLGIPARAVNGYNFSNGTAGAHAWVEISVDGKSWLPFEPQYKDDFILPRGYLPLMVAEAYEAQKNTDMSLDLYGPMVGQKLVITKTIK